jgi:two-component system, chemotaxis family, chemotaxis protein CheY
MSKILLINDCRFESLIMKDILDNEGHEVFISNEFEALEKIKFNYPDIVIVNLIMKTIQGDELINKIKSNNEEIKCILSSSNPIKLESYANKKVDAVIHTPINKNELLQSLELNINNKFKFCPYCGEKLNGDFNFCPKYGKKI